MRKRKLNDYTSGGFTLAEVVVATGVFAVVMLLLLSLFVFGMRGQQEATLQSRAQREAQFVIESIVKRVRTGIIDYAAYPGGIIPSNPNSDLALIDANGDCVVFRKDGNSLAMSRITPTTPGACPVPTQFLPITTTTITVESANFIIEPNTNPFVPQPSVRAQPRVTVVLVVRGQKGRQSVSLTLQMTVPERLTQRL